MNKQKGIASIIFIIIIIVLIVVVSFFAYKYLFSQKVSNNQSAITLLYPVGGEKLINSVGENIAQIKWKTNNLGSLGISIDLIDVNGSLKNIVSNIPNTGTYVWKNDLGITNGTYRLILYSGPELRGVGVSIPADSIYSDYFTITQK